MRDPRKLYQIARRDSVEACGPGAPWLRGAGVQLAVRQLSDFNPGPVAAVDLPGTEAAIFFSAAGGWVVKFVKSVKRAWLGFGASVAAKNRPDMPRIAFSGSKRPQKVIERHQLPVVQLLDLAHGLAQLPAGLHVLGDEADLVRRRLLQLLFRDGPDVLLEGPVREVDEAIAEDHLASVGAPDVGLDGEIRQARRVVETDKFLEGVQLHAATHQSLELRHAALVSAYNGEDARRLPLCLEPSEAATAELSGFEKATAALQDLRACADHAGHGESLRSLPQDLHAREFLHQAQGLFGSGALVGRAGAAIGGARRSDESGVQGAS